jgi:hypothetical protein
MLMPPAVFGAINDARRAKLNVAFAAAAPAGPEVHAAPVPGRVLKL